jgi:hypothetical protein
MNEREATTPASGSALQPELPVLRMGRWVLYIGGTSTTMSVEPGIIDANILVYAFNADAPQHTASRALLEAALDPLSALYVTSQILCAIPLSPTRAAFWLLLHRQKL